MASDRARVSYDPSRKWRGVIAQQGRVTVEADWNEAATIDEERDRRVTLDVVGPVGTPDGGYTVTDVPATGSPPAPPGDLMIGRGTLYLGGERLDLQAAVTYSTQPDWLDHSTDPLWVPPAVPTAAGTSYELVYLLASEQEVSAVEDPALADVALGGPDTMQRLRILQHFVRQAASPSVTCDSWWSALQSSPVFGGLQFDAASMMIRSTARLQVSFPSIPAAPSMCQPVATGGYLGAENQMIRVKVTDVDPTTNVPTIVWGFDDASFLYRVQAAPGNASTTLTLASAPVDIYHNPAKGQAVELLRDAVQLTASDYIASPAGFVSALTTAYDAASMKLVISSGPQGPDDPDGYPSDYIDATPQLYLRVWQATAAAPSGQPILLGDTGVAVTLSSNGAFHAGDFWRFALRPLDPAIVYPARYLDAPGQPPDGPRTWACPLAVLTWDYGNATASSCVPQFSDLVELAGAKGGCCTLNVGPGDVDNGTSLQALLDTYATRGPITVCLEPGTYTLPAPLLLGSELDGITLQACREGVVLQAQSEAGPEFVPGLIVMQDVSSVTIRNVWLSVPLATGFSPPPGSFGLSQANQSLLEQFSTGLQVAIGISVDGSAGLTVEDCTFELPDPGQANSFGAGIYATGAMNDLKIKGCVFQSASPPTTVPFNDLAAGNPAGPPYQLTFGYLQVPGASAFSTEATPQLLHNATIEQSLFQGLTVPAIVMAQIGTLRVDQNTVRNSYAGFWFVSIADPAQLLPFFDFFDQLVISDSLVYTFLANVGNSALADRIFVIAAVIGQVLPATPPTGGLLVPGRILTPSAAQLTLARQMIRGIFTRAARTGGPSRGTASGTAGGASGTGSGSSPAASGATTGAAEGSPPSAEPAVAAEEKVTGSAGKAELTELPPEIDAILTNLGAPASAPPIPVADTGTSDLSLRLDLCDGQVDAIIADSYSGAGLLVIDFTTGTGLALLHDNRIPEPLPDGSDGSRHRVHPAGVQRLRRRIRRGLRHRERRDEPGHTRVRGTRPGQLQPGAQRGDHAVWGAGRGHHRERLHRPHEPPAAPEHLDRGRGRGPPRLGAAQHRDQLHRTGGPDHSCRGDRH